MRTKSSQKPNCCLVMLTRLWNSQLRWLILPQRLHFVQQSWISARRKVGHLRVSMNWLVYLVLLLLRAQLHDHVTAHSSCMATAGEPRSFTCGDPRSCQRRKWQNWTLWGLRIRKKSQSFWFCLLVEKQESLETFLSLMMTKHILTKRLCKRISGITCCAWGSSHPIYLEYNSSIISPFHSDAVAVFSSPSDATFSQSVFKWLLTMKSLCSHTHMHISTFKTLTFTLLRKVLSSFLSFLQNVQPLHPYWKLNQLNYDQPGTQIW